MAETGVLSSGESPMSNQDTDEQRLRSTEDEFVEMALEFLRNITFP